MPNNRTEQKSSHLLLPIIIVQFSDVILRDFLPSSLLHMIDCHTQHVIISSAVTTVICYIILSLLIQHLKLGTKQVRHNWNPLNSVLWHCWFSIRKSTQPVQNWMMRCWRGYLSSVGSEMQMSCICYRPADATATPLSLTILKSKG